MPVSNQNNIRKPNKTVLYNLFFFFIYSNHYKLRADAMHAKRRMDGFSCFFLSWSGDQDDDASMVKIVGCLVILIITREHALHAFNWLLYLFPSIPEELRELEKEARYSHYNKMAVGPQSWETKRAVEASLPSITFQSKVERAVSQNGFPLLWDPWMSLFSGKERKRSHRPP